MQGEIQKDQYKKFNGQTEQTILNFFNQHQINCVKCKVDLPADPTFSFPVVNSLSISITRADNSVIHAVPHLLCDSCGYENSILKLLRQV